MTKEEFQQLEANIFGDGDVINHIIVWNGVIVDGHNRYKIILKHPEINIPPMKSHFLTEMTPSPGFAKTSLDAGT